MRESNPELHRQRVSASLKGRYGELARAWKGDKAGYVAIHMWVAKHWGKPDHCDMCHAKDASRYEWCNLDKQYRRIEMDWVQLCPSCHRIYDCSIIRERVYGDRCRNGHIYIDNLAFNNRGHRFCLACRRDTQGRYNAKNN